MNWVLVALLTALAAATQDAWVKRHFAAASPYEMMAYPLAYSLPMFCLAVPFIRLPPLDNTFFAYFVASIPINGLGYLLHIRAIQVSPLSLTLPYLALTPIFMLLTGFVVLGELPNGWGLIGILVIVSGGYVLNIDPRVYSPLAPIRAFGREKGSVLMLMVSLIYSLGAVVGKKAILHSSVMFFTVTFFISLCVVMLAAVIVSGHVELRRLAVMPAKGTVAGGLLFLHAVCHGWAISMTKAVYMISLKRVSILIGVIYGGLFFRERHLIYRMTGTVMMIAGAAIISLKGL